MTSKRKGTMEVTHDGRTISWEVVTPDEASGYLETMPPNRKVSQRLVSQLVDAAVSGQFFTHVAPIHFDVKGKLRNGQHRMWMVVESGIPQEFEVIRGATEQEIDALDTGKNRTTSDVLAMDGIENANLLSAALVNMWLYESGEHLPGMGRTMYLGDDKRGLSNQNIKDYLKLHPSIVDSVKYMKETPAVRLLGSPAMLAFCHYVITMVNKVEGPEFFDIIAKQRFASNDDPAFRLHQRLKRAKESKQRANKLTATEIGALTIRAFNLWLAGTEVRSLRWRASGDLKGRKGDDFPKPLTGIRKVIV